MKHNQKYFCLFLLLTFLFILSMNSVICMAQPDNDEDLVPKIPVNLDHTDVLKAIEIIQKEYYEPLTGKILLENFLTGIRRYASRKRRANPLADIKPTDNVKKVVNEIGEKFKQNAVSEKGKQTYILQGIRRMIRSLDNPGCKFYMPGKYRETLQEMGYNKGGCGFFVDEEKKDADGRWKVIETLQDFPAEKKGVRAGDRLVAVDKKSVKDLTFKELARVVRGPIGSKVTLKVYRPELEKEIDITITRTWLGPNPKSLRHEILPGNIGYIKFRYLGERMNIEIKDIYKEFRKKKVKKVIWDFRNSAALLKGSLDLASLYAPKDKVFAYKGSHDWKESYLGKGGIKGDLPAVILTNKYTSAGCMILALVLKKYHKIPTVGQPMTWDGDENNSHRLRDGAYFTLTYAYYWLADGRKLKNKVVIKPDVEVKQNALPPYKDGDKQLKKALEMLSKK
ncbi:MAG: PDZ domain-containing protein [Candidatus Eremiobacteraeota bacterium]|nr:PDZ domain-containing protein [Candidatus Eremiobacteraeota bacterium]